MPLIPVFALPQRAFDGDDRRRLGESVGRRHPTSEALLKRVAYRLGKVRPARPHVGQGCADRRAATSSELARPCKIVGTPNHELTASLLIHCCDTDRVDPVHHDLRAARLGHEERARDLHVEDGQRGAVALPQIRDRSPARPPASLREAAGSDGSARRPWAVRSCHWCRRSRPGPWLGDRPAVAGRRCCRPCPARSRSLTDHDDGRRRLPSRIGAEAVRDIGRRQQEASPASRRMKCFSGGARLRLTPSQIAPSRATA